MDTPLVSIVIPCFNGGSYVDAAIESALTQTYSHKEIIVVDDGSTDNSLTIIKRRCGRVSWLSQPNRGGSAARNRGLELARGEFIQFLDADDLLEPNKLQAQVPVLTSSHADMVYSDWIECSMDQPSKRQFCSVPCDTEDSVIVALHRRNIQTAAPIHRKATVVAAGGFREDFPCCQEREFHLRLAWRGARFRRLPGHLHTVRLRHGSVSSDRDRISAWMHRLLTEAYKSLNRNGGLTNARKVAFATLLARQGRILVRHRAYDEASRFFADARLMHPDGGVRHGFGRFGGVLVSMLGPVAAAAILWQIRKLIDSPKSMFRSPGFD